MIKVFTKTALTLVLLFVVNICFSQESKFGKLSYNKAVNVSGKQRMLTQRMGKIYLYLLNYPNDFKAKNDLKITKIIFEKQNLILGDNTSSGLTRSRLKDVNNTWEKYKEFLDSSPNKNDAVKVVNTNSTILQYTNNVVNAILLEAKGSTNSSDSYLEEEDSELKEIINKAGRQRMLAQRLALYYFANKPSLKTANTEAKLSAVFSEIDNAITDLLISSFNNDRIDETLGAVMGVWEEVKSNKSRLLKQGYNDKEVYKLSNDLTKYFNKITTLYEKVKLE